MNQKPHHKQFLKDVFLCALASYGGPEAHYGIFSKELVDKKGYVSQEEMTELIGIFSLLPGPSSTQTITAIGYRVGGSWIALLTLIIWIFPALVIMSFLGVALDWIAQQDHWRQVLTYLPATAVAFIAYAAIQLTRKVLHDKRDVLIYGIFCIMAFLTLKWSVWMVLLLLLLGGSLGLLPILGQARMEILQIQGRTPPKWHLIGLIIVGALLLSWSAQQFGGSLTVFSSIYRYGYSVIGGGQIMIPLMIQDLVEQHGFLSQADFLAGYTLDQAVPGPLFSFASFVTARSVSGSPLEMFISGIIGGGLIFLPGTLLVYFATPLWQEYRQLHYVRYFLKGIGLVVAAIITYTAIHQLTLLGTDSKSWLVFLIASMLLLSKKIPAPLIVLISLLAGLFFS